MEKQQWINEVYALLCKSQGAPENATEEKNLREWAESMAETESYSERMTPKEAHDEELSCA